MNSKPLSKVAPQSARCDRRVTWAEGCKPAAVTDTHGTVFTSDNRVTFVYWDGASKPRPVATTALVLL